MTRSNRWILFPALLAVACGGPASTPTATTTGSRAPVAANDAKAQFEALCVSCHGGSGHGDGPGASTLEPKPRSFADEAWQTSVTDEHIKKAIVFGGAAVGKSAMMPPQPQLKGNDALLDGLVQVVRGFRGK